MSSAATNSFLTTFLICSACIVACGGSQALADETYSYTGVSYAQNECYGTYVANCTSYHLTGSFTTTLSLSQLEGLTSFSLPAADLFSFSFSDGSGLTLSGKCDGIGLGLHH